jgi:hypothetical protein
MSKGVDNYVLGDAPEKPFSGKFPPATGYFQNLSKPVDVFIT